MPITTAAGTPINYGVYGTTVTNDTDPRVCYYTHFDLGTEQLGRTQRYNCWGFTFLPRRYWINSDVDVDNIIRDNCFAIPDGSVQCGDVIRYRDDSGITTHTGRVWETDGAGHATLVRSKWGGWAEYIHQPLDVPSIYGTHLAYFRQHSPLLGVADLWIKDSPADDGEQYSSAPWWVSPDIFLDVPPYDGIPDLNPVFNNTNRIWARVSNRSNLTANNVYVRYYWADPSAGLPPSGWNLIPGTPEHPNPAGPITIPGYSSVECPYVEWTPSASPVHQCLLAIAYFNDDPRDSNNPDPIVYPFDVPWDNNIGQRNVQIITSRSGSNHRFSIFTGLPFLIKGNLNFSLNAVLTHTHKLALHGQTAKVIPLKVALALEGHERFEIVPQVKPQRIGGYNVLAERRLLGAVVASAEKKKLTFKPERRYKIDVEINVPKEAVAGSVYYLHITQKVSQTVTGGYTFGIMVE